MVDHAQTIHTEILTEISFRTNRSDMIIEATRSFDPIAKEFKTNQILKRLKHLKIELDRNDRLCQTIKNPKDVTESIKN